MHNLSAYCGFRIWRLGFHVFNLESFFTLLIVRNTEMETQSCDAVHPRPQVKATFSLASESYSVQANKGSLSEQLVSLKEESMTILKDFITKHNVPHDVPDEPLEASSDDDDDDIHEKPQAKSKKSKLT
ncbi:hypothetical protein VNO77_21684 [Canavalia gladiata]|uniref:Uncharacterized protein n=1 Tax=Canavalia gladiata TaxID=3824 RepID=A0AAN9LRK3_CANGL